MMPYVGTGDTAKNGNLPTLRISALRISVKAARTVILPDQPNAAIDYDIDVQVAVDIIEARPSEWVGPIIPIPNHPP